MKHTSTLVVRTYECDGNNHVNNATYLNYLEFARMEFLDAIGFDYIGFRKSGYAIYVTDIHIRYKGAAFVKDTLTIKTYPIQKKRLSGILKQYIYRGEEELIEAEVTYVSIGKNGRPAALPEEFDRPDLLPE